MDRARRVLDHREGREGRLREPCIVDCCDRLHARRRARGVAGPAVGGAVGRTTGRGRDHAAAGEAGDGRKRHLGDAGSRVADRRLHGERARRTRGVVDGRAARDVLRGEPGLRSYQRAGRLERRGRRLDLDVGAGVGRDIPDVVRNRVLVAVAGPVGGDGVGDRGGGVVRADRRERAVSPAAAVGRPSGRAQRSRSAQEL